MTTPIVGTTTGTTGTTGASGSSAETFGAGMGKDTFLKLLVAQLRYQNPLAPTDSQQYMAQMAQFTTVEKLADIQKSQGELATWQRTVAGQGMIGKQITATSANGDVTGRVTGMKLTDAGPRLVLSNGTTVGVDEVTAVDNVDTSAPTPPPATVPPAATPTPTTPTTPPAAAPPATATATPPATTPTATTKGA
jgi:flagellar basal-body rod modification protein FlgD